MKKTILSAAFFAVTFCSAYGTQQKENNHILWYDEPAATWTEALPIGNSRLGAMIFGSPSADRLQLNEETIWAGRPNNNANPEALEYLPKVRQLVWEGKYKEAQENYKESSKRLELQDKTYSLVKDKLEIGSASDLDVLYAKQAYLMVKKDEVSNKMNSVISTIGLYKATGGMDLYKINENL